MEESSHAGSEAHHHVHQAREAPGAVGAITAADAANFFIRSGTETHGPGRACGRRRYPNVYRAVRANYQSPASCEQRPTEATALRSAKRFRAVEAFICISSDLV